jgi:acyl carrier protein
MDTSPEALVHRLLASRLHVDPASIDDTDRLDDLGLGPIDLVLVVLQLVRLGRRESEFPLSALEHATTVGDFVDLVELWLQSDTMPSAVADEVAGR